MTIGWIESWAGHGFPWGTLGVNVLGALALGIVVESLALAWSPSPAVSAMITVGVIGAFTTFSTFSVDLFLQIERGEMVLAFLYAASSVLLTLGGLFAGLRLTRLVLL
ncbi:MAG: fluoride efflux transporter FluC [Alphaproteobacteria bacterium]